MRLGFSSMMMGDISVAGRAGIVLSMHLGSFF